MPERACRLSSEHGTNSQPELGPATTSTKPIATPRAPSHRGTLCELTNEMGHSGKPRSDFVTAPRPQADLAGSASSASTRLSGRKFGYTANMQYQTVKSGPLCALLDRRKSAPGGKG